MSELRTIDVSDLPESGSGVRSLVWWANCGLICIEGTMFAMLASTYFYLQLGFDTWPPPGVHPPSLLLPTINLAILLLTCVPFYLADRASAQGDVRRTQWLIVAGGVLTLAFLVIRAIDLHALNYKWNSHAYGSIVWAILFIHTAHVATFFFETAVMFAATFKKGIDGHVREDVEVDALYWYFITAAWVFFYFVIYIAPQGMW